MVSMRFTGVNCWICFVRHVNRRLLSRDRQYTKSTMHHSAAELNSPPVWIRSRLPDLGIEVFMVFQPLPATLISDTRPSAAVSNSGVHPQSSAADRTRRTSSQPDVSCPRTAGSLGVWFLCDISSWVKILSCCFYISSGVPG